MLKTLMTRARLDLLITVVAMRYIFLQYLNQSAEIGRVLNWYFGNNRTYLAVVSIFPTLQFLQRLASLRVV